MSQSDKILAIRLALADIGFLVRHEATGRIIQKTQSRDDRVELSLLRSRSIIRLHDDYPRYIERLAA